jgi:hypothetical protein
MKVKESKAHDYSVERRRRDSSCTSSLQFWACHAITAKAVAEAPSRIQCGIASDQRNGKHAQLKIIESLSCFISRTKPPSKTASRTFRS